MRRTLIGAAASAIFLSVMAAPAGAGGGGHCDPNEYAKTVSGPKAVVELRDACFNPTVLYVEEDAEVTFVNRDPYLHNLSGPAGTFVEGVFDDLQEGEEETFWLQTPGAYPYMCYIHPAMAGVVIVGDGGTGTGRDAMNVGSQGMGTSSQDGSSTPALMGLGIAMVLLIAAVARLATRKGLPTAS